MNAAGPASSRVTVVVVTRDRRASALDTLRRLERAAPARVIVVDNASSDGTAAAIASAHPEVELVRLDHNSGAAARNVGVARAPTDLVAFCDDDSWWEEDALHRAVAVFEAHPRLGLLAARVVVDDDGTTDPTSAGMSSSPLGAPDGMPDVLGFLACAAIVRRDAFLEAGGFHPRFGIGGEEALLALDLADRGWRLAYVDSIVAQHRPLPGHDRRGRRAAEMRNALWLAWLRRPPRRAVEQAAELVRRAMGDVDARRALLDAIRGAPWVIRERRCLRPRVERMCRSLETSEAR